LDNGELTKTVVKQVAEMKQTAQQQTQPK